MFGEGTCASTPTNGSGAGHSLLIAPGRCLADYSLLIAPGRSPEVVDNTIESVKLLLG